MSLNPYAPPGEQVLTTPADELNWYTATVRGRRWRELWRQVSIINFLLIAVVRSLGFLSRPTQAYSPDRFLPNEDEQLQKQASEAFAPVAEQLKQAGFSHVAEGRLPTLGMIPQLQSYYLSHDGRILSPLSWDPQQPKLGGAMTFLTRVVSGNPWMTTTLPMIPTADGMERAESLPRADFQELYARHLERVASVAAVPFTSRTDVVEWIVQSEQRSAVQLVEAGYLVRLTPAEVARLREQTEGPVAAALAPVPTPPAEKLMQPWEGMVFFPLAIANLVLLRWPLEQPRWNTAAYLLINVPLLALLLANIYRRRCRQTALLADRERAGPDHQ